MDILLLSSGTKAGNVNADFLVPAGIGEYKVLYGHLVLTTNATVANRQVSFGIYDDAGSPALIFDTHAGVTVPANQSSINFELMPGIFRESAIVAGSVQVPIPMECRVRGGWTIRLAVGAGVAGDSYTVKLAVEPIGSR